MGSRLRVLLVDPDRDVRETIADLLHEPIAGTAFDVETFGDSEAAARALGAGHYDILLCHLPALHDPAGGLIRHARALDPKLRVVAMSANGSRARRGEADARLAKPFSRAQLLAALRPG